jgi:integrase/recombinase XerD
MTAVTAAELARDAEEFLRFKRAMGIAYVRGEFVLAGFIRFVARQWGERGEVALDEAVTRWCARVRLRMADVDLDRGTLAIQHSKGRSRIVAIRADLVAELRHHAAERRRLLDERRQPDPEAFFLRLNAVPLTVASASQAIRRLLRQLGLKPPAGRSGARPYEFRHAFAVHRLMAWADDGVDIQAKLPLLSAYLGHRNLIGTEVYLKATPQLLELASSRFERHLRGAPP